MREQITVVWNDGYEKKFEYIRISWACGFLNIRETDNEVIKIQAEAIRYIKYTGNGKLEKSDM